MFKNNILAVCFVSLVLLLAGCKKEKYTFGGLKAPSDLTLSAVIEGVDATNPNGNGSGNVLITASSKNALSYKIDFGDGNSRVVPGGTLTYKYTNPGTSDYTITVNAIGTGGATSTVSKRV